MRCLGQMALYPGCPKARQKILSIGLHCYYLMQRREVLGTGLQSLEAQNQDRHQSWGRSQLQRVLMHLPTHVCLHIPVLVISTNSKMASRCSPRVGHRNRCECLQLCLCVHTQGRPNNGFAGCFITMAGPPKRSA